MSLTPRRPLDRYAYERDPRSRMLSPDVGDGRFVYVVDLQSRIWVVPDDGPHLHPKVLGNRQSALYAGEMTIHQSCVKELTNCSGTYQFRSEQGLLEVAGLVELCGLRMEADSLVFHYFDRVSRPKVLPYPVEASGADQ
jgi:hypothetical protein